MERLAVDLRDERARETPLVGAKGASLAMLVSMGLSIPPGFCVTTLSYADCIGSLQAKMKVPSTGDMRDTAPSREQRAWLRSRLDCAEIPDALWGEVSAALAELGTTSCTIPLRLAVRSSATAEDAPGASFAGQYVTHLNVFHPSTLLNHVRACWASFWSERAYAYRTQMGKDHWASRMAVLIQELVPALASGTVFTMNPLAKSGREAVVEACRGLGKELSSGRTCPDTYYVRTSGDHPIVTRRLAGTQRTMLMPRADGKEGTQVVDVPPNEVGQPILSDTQVSDLVATGLALAERLGYHLDIEWAWCHERMWLLQARPMTGPSLAIHSFH